MARLYIEAGKASLRDVGLWETLDEVREDEAMQIVGENST